MEKRDLARLRGDAIDDDALVMGYVLRQATGADQVLLARMLSAPLLVERGHRVQLLTSVPGLDIRMTGVSLDDGARGDSVRVRNPVSNRVVRAKVIQPGIVQMIAARVIKN
jgi:flagella basal body P-ring formation protein FlgA